jgi:signal transduction histidine kinase
MKDSASLATAVVVQTQEEERYRLARSLQDGPGQLLANAALEIETCLQLMEDQPTAAREGLTALLGEIRLGLVNVRDLVGERKANHR